MVIRKIRSVCPICLKNIPAVLERKEDGSVFLEKKCGIHGSFSVPVWHGKTDFDAWTADAEELAGGQGTCCPGQCGLCGEHENETCCTLIEVTGRCNLRCAFCFADRGNNEADPSCEELEAAINDIAVRCSGPLIQFSGGEPTLRDDLPHLVRLAKEAGCSYTQVNTNGIRLAKDPDYAAKLARAGLDIVFLQFDGTNDEIYEKLRGERLLAAKLEAIKVCSDLRIGVTLVPTVVRNVNDNDLGNIIKFAVSHSPGVRGIHFQPVSYFGRFPNIPENGERYTLDDLITDISDQADIPVSSFLPSRCDHPLCGFHAGFLIEKDGSLKPLSGASYSSHAKCSAVDNRRYIARHWMRSDNGEVPSGDLFKDMDFDTFLYRLKNCSLTLSAMAFQDAMNLNIERLHRCSLHVYEKGKIIPFCAKYLSSMK